MKTILLSILLTCSVFAVTILEQPIQYNAIDLETVSINTTKRYATVSFKPVAINEEGGIIAEGPVQKPVKISEDVLVPVSCMTISELGLTTDSNFAEALFKVILTVAELDPEDSTFRWPTRIPVTYTNIVSVETVVDGVTNIVAETEIVNSYKYE